MTHISRHNYEEFFLLYVDGELSAAEKLAIEQFVRQNPDLAGELEMLQQTLLPSGEAVAFTGKTALYRGETAQTTLANYEEQFLYYIDNELDATARVQLETFVLQNPALQDAFTLLKQTRLEPETVVFPDKQLLYRTAERETPLVYIRWWRMAAAASVIGLGVLLWTLSPNDNDTATPETVTAVIKPAPLQNNEKEASVTGSTGVAALANESHHALMPTGKGIAGNGRETTNRRNTVATQQPVMVQNNREATPAELKREEIIIARNESAGINEVPATKIPASAAIAEPDIIKNPAAADEPAEATTLVQPVVYKELDTEEDNKSLLLGSVEINKDKLRGFFRKASSLFRSKARQEEEKPENSTTVNTRSLK